MKKLVSLAIAAILVFVLAVPAFALEPETQVIDLGTVDLGNGVSYHTVLTIENSALRASVKKGSITRDFSYYGAAIGSVQLNGIFSYDGHTATATSASVYHTVSNGWSYGGESFPEHVCRYILGVYYEISKYCNSIHLEFYRQGQKVDTLEIKIPPIV